MIEIRYCYYYETKKSDRKLYMKKSSTTFLRYTTEELSWDELVVGGRRVMHTHNRYWVYLLRSANHRWMRFFNALFGMRNVCWSWAPFMGLVAGFLSRAHLSNQSWMAARSYVCPSAAVTGSVMICVVIGQQYPSGVSSPPPAPARSLPPPGPPPPPPAGGRDAASRDAAAFLAANASAIAFFSAASFLAFCSSSSRFFLLFAFLWASIQLVCSSSEM